MYIYFVSWVYQTNNWWSIHFLSETQTPKRALWVRGYDLKLTSSHGHWSQANDSLQSIPQSDYCMWYNPFRKLIFIGSVKIMPHEVLISYNREFHVRLFAVIHGFEKSLTFSGQSGRKSKRDLLSFLIKRSPRQGLLSASGEEWDCLVPLCFQAIKVPPVWLCEIIVKFLPHGFSLLTDTSTFSSF